MDDLIGRPVVEVEWPDVVYRYHHVERVPQSILLSAVSCSPPSLSFQRQMQDMMGMAGAGDDLHLRNTLMLQFRKLTLQGILELFKHYHVK